MIKIKDFTENTFREATEKANEFIETLRKESNSFYKIIKISHEVTQTLLPPGTPNLGPRLVTKHYIMIVYDTWKNDKLYADSLTDTIEIPLNEDEEDEVYGDY
ncbi:MAG: hypothetical protein IKF29_00400 [Oceanobacillus sp.]|nr:hypothetical protein [Oceanobacillus sp.]